jgi:hypothetical protein
MPSSSSHVKLLPNVPLTTLERALLLNAHANWEDEAVFSDDKVQDVKSIFQRVFADEDAPLLGSLFSDALVMQPKYNKRIYYAMVLEEGDEIVWQKAQVESENFKVLSSSLEFSEFLMFAGTSPLLETEEEIRMALLHDCFMLLKRNPSRERLARITTNSKCPFVRTKPLEHTIDTRYRLLWELRMLGFDDHSHNGRISAMWVDWERTRMGYAPQSFSINHRGDYESDPPGVYIHETHAPSALRIETWEDWDAWLCAYIGL